MPGTFWGANLTFGHRRPDRGWQVEYKDALAAKGIQTHFIPAFSDSQCSAETIFKNYKVLDGIMNWESWPWTGGPPDETADLGYLRAADAKYKTFMMSKSFSSQRCGHMSRTEIVSTGYLLINTGISTHQFKHLASDQNWFRPGALTLPYRMQQVLDLSPHFVQIQTWNDAGESHYMGNVWPNSIHGSPCHAYIDEYPHKAWQILYRSFIVAYKAGARHVRDMRPSKGLIEGAFWYHPHFGDVNVPEDDYGVPRGREWAEGVVNVAIVVGDIEEENVWATVYSGDGDVQIASCRLKPGLNAFKAQEVRPGVQRVLVSVMSDVPRGLASGTGDVQVSAAPKSWNLNYAVVALENV